jgi:predicted Na+-dependent transporter
MVRWMVCGELMKATKVLVPAMVLFPMVFGQQIQGWHLQISSVTEKVCNTVRKASLILCLGLSLHPSDTLTMAKDLMWELQATTILFSWVGSCKRAGYVEASTLSKLSKSTYKSMRI